jgi:hypothetical protein
MCITAPLGLQLHSNPNPMLVVPYHVEYVEASGSGPGSLVLNNKFGISTRPQSPS